ncbi:sensor histidine kinase [Cohnella silvisoli]|uniref:histidine kinase n=1 Tax=Cohnella silvisoli TaxID=2873699 RepID=A0ABV1L4B6_9BACL|nr:sensor histidine kinase [Cohnella silvisoli]MCD9026424.1 sensor histidine kinase [Cohnella silvisoli]
MNRLWLAKIALRFKTKVVLSFLIGALVPVLVLGIYSYQQSQTFIHNQAIAGLNNTVGTVAGNIDNRFSQYNGIVDSIILNTGIQQIFDHDYVDYINFAWDNRNYLEPYFKTILTVHKEIAKIMIYHSSNLPDKGLFYKSATGVKDQIWYTQASKQTQDYSTVWMLDHDKLYAARKFPDILMNGKDTVLYLELDASKVFDLFNDKTTTDDYEMFVYDDRLQPLFVKRGEHSARAELNAGQLSSMENELTEIDGVNYILVKKTIPSVHWRLYYLVPLQSISLDAGNIARATLLIIAFCVVVLIVLIWLITKTLLRRINELNKKMKLVENGNLQIEVTSHVGDEIGELTNRFGRMIRHVNELIQENYQNKIVQKDAELKALQAQINPHFLYNTLSIINWSALEIEAENISHLVTTLSNYYRTALNKGNNVIAIRDEMENTKAYLTIQLAMHDHKFDVALELDEEIYEYKTINLMLQPIVENALQHGIDCKEDGRGWVSISVAFAGDDIEFVVSDNGPGMDPSLIDEILVAGSRGYGIKNVNDRIQLLFGEAYGLRIESVPGSGTTVVIRIPKYRGPPSD